MSKNILVIEDDQQQAEMAKIVLRSKGYEVETAYDGESGWQMVQDTHPDLVVTDLQLPRLSGREICKRIRATPGLERTLILVISGITAGSDKPDHFWAAGLSADDFLPKPFDPLGLIGRVEYLFRKQEYVTHSSDPKQTIAPKRGVTSEDSSIGVPRTAGAVPPRPAGMTPRTRLGANASASATPVPGGLVASKPPMNSARAGEPADVVRVFVEAWNTQHFAAEYDCLCDELLAGLRRADYVERRLEAHAAESLIHSAHRVLTSDSQVSGQMATVTIEREDTVRGAPQSRSERYVLRLSPNGWKIVSVKVLG